MSHLFAEGAAAVQVSLLRPRHGASQRVWTDDGCEFTFVGTADASRCSFEGGGVCGGAAGEPCTITVVTADAQGRPRRLGGPRYGGLPLHSVLLAKGSATPPAAPAAAEPAAAEPAADPAAAALAAGAPVADAPASAGAPAAATSNVAAAPASAVEVAAGAAAAEEAAPPLAPPQRRGSLRGGRRGSLLSASFVAPPAVVARGVIDHGDGSLSVEYGADVAGAYELRLLHEGQLLQAFDVTLLAAPAEPALSEVGGSALVASTPGEHELTISLYDRRRNAAAWPQAGVRVVLLSSTAAGVEPRRGSGRIGSNAASGRIGASTAAPAFECLLSAPPEAPLLLPLLDAGTYYLSVTLEPAGTPIGDVKRHPISIVAPKVTAPPDGEGEDALAEPGA